MSKNSQNKKLIKVRFFRSFSAKNGLIRGATIDSLFLGSAANCSCVAPRRGECGQLCPEVENPGYRQGSPSEKRKKGPEFPEKLGPRYSRFGQLSMSDLSSVVFTPVVAARCYLEVEPTERSVEPASPEKRLVLIVQRGQ